MNFESVNLTEAILLVTSYKKSMKKLIEKIKSNYSFEQFYRQTSYFLNNITKTLEELNLEYSLNLSNAKLTIFSKFDKSLNVSAKLRRENGK